MEIKDYNDTLNQSLRNKIRKYLNLDSVKESSTMSEAEEIEKRMKTDYKYGIKNKI